MPAPAAFLRPWLSSLQPGPAAQAGPVTLIPLLGPDRSPAITTLGAHRGAEQVDVREVSESGVVARVLVVNGSLLPLLLLDGEELVGAKQNRVVNASTLVGAGVSLEVPVSCCERGRWRNISRGFRSEGRSMPWSLKAQKHSRVTSSLLNHRGFDADQGALWRDVDTYLTDRNVRSRSDALSDAFDADREEIDRLRRQLLHDGPLPNQVGVAFALRGKLLGLEIFGSNELYAQAHERLLHACLTEALGVESGPSEHLADPIDLVMAVLTEPSTSQPSSGLGEDHRFEGRRGSGFLLSWREAPIHAGVFAR